TRRRCVLARRSGDLYVAERTPPQTNVPRAPALGTKAPPPRPGSRRLRQVPQRRLCRPTGNSSFVDGYESFPFILDEFPGCPGGGVRDSLRKPDRPLRLGGFRLAQLAAGSG